MPTNKLIQSLLNPVKFILYTPDTNAQHLSRHMDDFFYYETIKPWQQRKNYYQPWMKTDSIILQFQSEISPLKLSLLDGDERVYTSFNMTAGAYVFDNPALHVYESSIALTSYTPGLYFLKLECGIADGDGNFPLVLISEPLEIADNHKDTLLLQYSHREYYNDIAFETGFSPQLRIRATLRFKNPSSKDTLFEDQPLNLSMLLSKPFRTWELKIGGASGIPDYLADMINRVLGCSKLLIEGKGFTKADGSKMEESTAANYPMRGWSIDLRESDNIISKVYHGIGTDTTPPAIISAVAINDHTIRVTFSKNVIPTTVGWSLYIADLLSTSGFTAVSGSGSVWYFTTTPAMLPGQMLFINYNALTGNTLDLSGNELPTVFNYPVMNSVAGVIFTAFVGHFTSDPYGTLSGGTDILSWPISATFTHNGSMSFNISSIPAGRYVVVKEPVSEPLKTNWFNTSFNNGPIPDSVFWDAVENSGFRYYITRNPVALNTTQPLNIS